MGSEKEEKTLCIRVYSGNVGRANFQLRMIFTLGDLSIVFVVPSKTIGPMDGLLPSLGGFFNCVLHTYSSLLSDYKVFK
jgi:hypothetical protein